MGRDFPTFQIPLWVRSSRFLYFYSLLILYTFSYIVSCRFNCSFIKRLVFFSLTGKKKRLEKPIQKNLTSHIFRHTLVSRLAENNVPLKAIMDRVGHADAKTTIQIYTHVTKKMKSNVADIMENY